MKKSTNWDWLPEHMRKPVAASGLFHPTSEYTQLGTARGKVWVTDGHFMIAIGDASALPAIKRRMRHQFRQIKEATLEHVIGMCSSGYRRAKPVRSLSDARLIEAPNYPAIALGRVALQRTAHEMVRALWPDARWLTRGRLDPVFVQADGATVAALMPLCCTEAA